MTECYAVCCRTHTAIARSPHRESFAAKIGSDIPTLSSDRQMQEFMPVGLFQ